MRRRKLIHPIMMWEYSTVLFGCVFLEIHYFHSVITYSAAVNSSSVLLYLCAFQLDIELCMSSVYYISVLKEKRFFFLIERHESKETNITLISSTFKLLYSTHKRLLRVQLYFNECFEVSL